jgi:signal transduction histidine kinase
MDAIVPYSRAAILLYHDQQMEFAATRGYPANVNMEHARVLVNNNPIFNEIIQERKVSTVDDVILRADWQHIPNTLPTRSWLGVPLVHHDEVLGMLSVSRLMVVPFTPDEMELSESFAGQAAVALGNAHLYEQIQSFTHELEERVQERTQELRSAYSKLEVLDKNKSNFIKIASHEIKTPLTVVSGYAQMLSQDPVLEPRHRDLLKSLQEGMGRLGGIVNTMLDVARLDNREMQLDFKALNLSSLVAGIIDEFANGLQERKINCVIENFGSMPVIQGDKDALRKAFYHVIVNAIKYTPDQGHITIKGSLPGMRDGEEIASSVQVTVKDSGIGIDPKDHELIFDRFYQTGQVMLHSSGKTKFKGGGSGLGLAVSRGIIEAHGGQIWVESAGHDETTMPGSSFHIVLPIRGQG